MITNILSRLRKRKPAVTFWSENEIINDLYPVYPAKEYKRKWVKNCATAFKKYKEKSAGKYTLLTVAKCVGIRNVMEAGYIVQTWCDIVIETKDGKFEVSTPEHLNPVLQDINYQEELVTHFDMRYSPVRIPVSEDNFQSILKFKSPYTFEVQPGYQCLILPVAYDDNPNFTACMGITDGLNPNFNVHLYWHVKEGRVHIPAGTPLCQVVPIKMGYEVETQPATPEVVKRIRQKEFSMNNTFDRGGTNF